MNIKYMIGLKCKKKSKKGTEPKKFKSGCKINTIKGLVIHPFDGNPAFIFNEDESYVHCHNVILLDDNEKEVHQNDIERQRSIHKKRLKNDNQQ
jgi:hypothetical protein